MSKLLLLITLTLGCVAAHWSSEHDGCNHQPLQCTKTTCDTWSYEGDEGPTHWSDPTIGAALCGTGTSQSPVSLLTANATRANLGPVFFSHQYRHKLDGIYKNTGDSAKFTPFTVKNLTITGGPLSSTYQLAQFHFHWGCTDLTGSEHTIDGRQYSLEMHLVHYNTAYRNLSNAVSRADGLAVVGIMFQADHNNHNYEPLKYGTNTLGCVRQPLSQYSGHVDLGDFIQTIHSKGYFTYPGSLTTPTCNEAVTWIVYRRPITIPTKQLESFRRLNTCNCTELCDTFRPVQPLNNRIVKLVAPLKRSSSSSSEEFW